MCAAHKICRAGEWTEVAGDATTDTKCTTCSTGRFRATAPTDNQAESKVHVCSAHKVCKAGEWTKATGTATTDKAVLLHALVSFWTSWMEGWEFDYYMSHAVCSFLVLPTSFFCFCQTWVGVSIHKCGLIWFCIDVRSP